jgi:hypothetical protein
VIVEGDISHKIRQRISRKKVGVCVVQIICWERLYMFSTGDKRVEENGLSLVDNTHIHRLSCRWFLAEFYAKCLDQLSPTSSR